MCARVSWLVFAQLTYRESLRDIETGLSAQSAKLLGIRGSVARAGGLYVMDLSLTMFETTPLDQLLRVGRMQFRRIHRVS